MLLSVAVVVGSPVSMLTLVMELVGVKHFKEVMVEPVDIKTLTLKPFLVLTILQSVAVVLAVFMAEVQLQEMQQLVLA
jgi:hypothetical protein